MARKYLRLVTTPAYYPNDKPHIGHLYSNITATLIANKLGRVLLSGNDVHGQKIRIYAERLGMDINSFVVKNGQLFKQNLIKTPFLRRIIFSNTHSFRHVLFVRKLWNRLIVSKYVFRDLYSGYYLINEERFVQKKDIKKLDRSEYLEEVSESNLFLSVKGLSDKIRELYKSGKIRVYPDFFLKSLDDSLSEIDNFCLTRNEKWGIKADGIEDRRTIHVWVDALLYYLSSIDYREGDFVDLVQVIGKDILVFHGVYWPAILLALGIRFRIVLYVTGWILVDSSKVSKSKGNVPKIDTDNKKLSFFLEQYSMGYDIRFSQLGIDRSVNYLVNNIGNLVKRVLGLLLKRGITVMKRVSRRSFRGWNGFKRLNTMVNVYKLWREDSSKIILSYLGSWISWLIIEFHYLGNVRALVSQGRDRYYLNLNLAYGLENPILR